MSSYGMKLITVINEPIRYNLIRIYKAIRFNIMEIFYPIRWQCRDIPLMHLHKERADRRSRYGVMVRWYSRRLEAVEYLSAQTGSSRYGITVRGVLPALGGRKIPERANRQL